MSVRKRGVALAAAVLTAAIVSLTLGPVLTAQGHTHTYSASISIRYKASGNKFLGHLGTGPPCRKGRVVSVFLVQPGADRLLGKDRTDSDGDYVVKNSAGLTGGFYAKTPREVRGDGYQHQHTCKKARSATINVTTP
jgi:hypothetical protein